ncbi:MAG: TraB/GumN family protein [Myxococcota bacterium]|nr:TraB/GumN family protein [Myxococcota bacterium]
MDLENFPNAVHLESNGRNFYLLGTAHISEHSVDEVKGLITAVEPDVVAVELCDTRHKALTDSNRWKNLDIFTVIKERKFLMLLANLAMASYQRRMGAKVGVEPGAELMAAIQSGKSSGARIELIDRDIQTTLRRTWASFSFWQKIKNVFGAITSVFDSQELQEEDIEALKSTEKLDDLMGQFAQAMPEVKKPLIDERDAYMVSKLQDIEGKKIVGVVGKGHLSGMVSRFEEAIDRPSLDVIPKAAAWVGALKWVIPAIILGAFAYGFQANEGRNFQELVLAWILPNAVAAAALTIVAGGKPLSILAAAIGSPITSLNPLIGAGMLVGLVEAWLRKPTVADCENLHHDIQTFRGFYANPFTRVLLVAALANVGSSMGAWIGLTWVVSKVT